MPDPRKDGDGITSRILQKQYKGYKNADPKPKQQKALPLSVIRNLHKYANTRVEKALAQLDTGAVFFAMRSCKYTKVPDHTERRTKSLCIRNFRFYNENKEISYLSSQLLTATSIAITFEVQKNEERNETVIHSATGDPLLCPVIAWAKTIMRLRSYPGTTINTPINIIHMNNKIYHIQSNDNIKLLRRVVDIMDASELGFTSSEIGTHSIRSGGAMAMKLAGIDDTTIKLLGRWRSDSFLLYIRKQVLQFSSKVSTRMLENEIFMHIPEFSMHNYPPSIISMASPHRELLSPLPSIPE